MGRIAGTSGACAQFEELKAQFEAINPALRGLGGEEYFDEWASFSAFMADEGHDAPAAAVAFGPF